MAFTTNSIEGYYNPDLGAPGYDQIFALTLLVYDYLITIGDEIEYLWKRPKTRSSLWFFVTRYMGLVGNVIITILIFMDPPVASCDGVGLFKEVLLLITQGVIGIILALRVYALYGCSPRILAFIMGSAIVLVAIASWLLLVQPVIFDGRSTTGCGTGPSFKSSMRIAGAWEALLVYDCIIFGLTIFKTWSARPDYAMTGISIPLITLLLRDGAIYFALMLFCKLLNILTFYFPIVPSQEFANNFQPFLHGDLATFASCMSLIMICRLMLNLHRTADSGIYTSHRALTELDFFHPTTGTPDIETSTRDSLGYISADSLKG